MSQAPRLSLKELSHHIDYRMHARVEQEGLIFGEGRVGDRPSQTPRMDVLHELPIAIGVVNSYPLICLVGTYAGAPLFRALGCEGHWLSLG